MMGSLAVGYHTFLLGMGVTVWKGNKTKEKERKKNYHSNAMRKEKHYAFGLALLQMFVHFASDSSCFTGCSASDSLSLDTSAASPFACSFLFFFRFFFHSWSPTAVGGL